MPTYTVLLTDYAWPDLEIERGILAEIDAELVVAPSSEPESLKELAANADAIMTNWARTPAEVIGASGKVQIVSRLGIGLDNIDVEYCTRQGIPVTNVPDYCVIEVAEHALAMILALGRKVAHYHLETQQGVYNLQSGPKLKRLEGQVLGIVGMGNIGRRLAGKAIALGFRVLGYNRSGKGMPAHVESCPLDSLLEASDYVSLHVPLNDQTRHLIDRRALERMKSTAYLVNTARGGIVDHDALAAALESDQIAGAALDVQEPEPPDLSRPPFNDLRVVVTPHAAFVSEESLHDLRTRVSRQVVDRLCGETPRHVVNPKALQP